MPSFFEVVRIVDSVETQALGIASEHGVVVGMPPHVLGIEDTPVLTEENEGQYAVDVAGVVYALGFDAFTATGRMLPREEFERDGLTSPAEMMRSKLAERGWSEFVATAREQDVDLGAVRWIGPPDSDAVRLPFSPPFPAVPVREESMTFSDESDFDGEVGRRLGAVESDGVTQCFFNDDMLGAFELPVSILLGAPDLVRRCLEVDGDTFYVVLDDQVAISCDLTEDRVEGRYEIATAVAQ